MVDIAQYSTRLEEVIKELTGDYTHDQLMRSVAKAHTLASSLLGNNHPTTQQLAEGITRIGKPHWSAWYPRDAFRGLMEALKSDLDSGFLSNLQISIRGDVEADFLGQADRLLEDKWKDPAAMLIGAVLEDTLRQICRTNGVPEGHKISLMNAPLRKSGVYKAPQEQQVTAWAAIRNKADHGQFEEYSLEEVRLMHQGVAAFVAQYLS